MNSPLIFNLYRIRANLYPPYQFQIPQKRFVKASGWGYMKRQVINCLSFLFNEVLRAEPNSYTENFLCQLVLYHLVLYPKA